MPSVLIRTANEIAQNVQQLRQCHDISYWIASDSVVAR